MADERNFEAALETIVARAWEDDEFKAEFLENPKSVIEQETREKIPDNLEIRVLEDTLNTRHFILPRQGVSLPESEELGQVETEDPLSAVVDKSVEDAYFRQQLMSNPKAVVEEELGIQFPQEVEIKVLENQSNLRYLVLPVSPEWDKDEDEGAIEIFKRPKFKTISFGACINNKC